MSSKCEKYKDQIITLCNDGLSCEEIRNLLPEKLAIATVWRYLKELNIPIQHISKSAFKKGNKAGEKKRKKIAWKVDENGCWICTSHKPGSSGYSITLVDGECVYIHRLMYEKYKGRIPDGIEACHKCDNPNCINPDHLFLGTHKENMSDRTSKGRDTNGERNGCAKLTDEQVIKILSLRHLKQAELAKTFNVTQPTISMILNNKRWKHL